jgi:hypothetical protein
LGATILVRAEAERNISIVAQGSAREQISGGLLHEAKEGPTSVIYLNL